MSEKCCPNCGHCPTCGRRDLTPWPYQSTPYRFPYTTGPIWIYNPFPYANTSGSLSNLNITGNQGIALT